MEGKGTQFKNILNDEDTGYITLDKKIYDQYDGDIQQIILEFANPVEYIGKFKGGEYDGKGIEFNYDIAEYLEGIDWYDSSYTDNLSEEENQKLNTIFDGTKEILITEGEFKNGKSDGKVKQYEYGYLLYDGEMKKGQYDGKGRLYYPLSTDLKYKGTFKKGEYNGKGTEYDENGNKIYSGKWSMGDYKN